MLIYTSNERGRRILSLFHPQTLYDLCYGFSRNQNEVIWLFALNIVS